MKINTNLYPPGGYEYQEADGTVLRADGWKDLYRRIEEYRARLGLNKRDVKLDVAAQICRAYPAYCHHPASAEEREKAMKTPSLKSRVMRWLGIRVQEKKRNPVKYVSGLLAKDRASICRACPKQTALRTTCATCIIAVREFRREILDRQTPDTSLGACSVTGADLPAAVFIDELAVANPELPPGCWYKRSL